MNIPPPGSLVEIWNGPKRWYAVDHDVRHDAAKLLTNAHDRPVWCLWYVTIFVATNIAHDDEDKPFTCALLQYEHEKGGLQIYSHVLVLHPEYGVLVGKGVNGDMKIVEVKP